MDHITHSSAGKNRKMLRSKFRIYAIFSSLLVTSLITPLSPANAQVLGPDMNEMTEQLKRLEASGSELSPAWVVGDIRKAEVSQLSADPTPPTKDLGRALATPGPDGLGALPYFGFHGIDLWGETSAGVNLANGNLYISSNDLSLNSPGISTRMTRHYNSQENTANSLGTWSSQHGQDIRLQINANTVEFHGPSGFYQDFTLVNGVWVSPVGLNAELVADGAGWKVTFVRSGEQMHFSSTGMLLKDTDRNGIGNHYGYTNGNLSSIIDAAGRETTITTSGSTTVYTTPDGRQLQYRLNSAGQLENMFINIETGPAMIIEFSYNAAGKLSSMMTPTNVIDGNGTTEFSYDAQNRVTEILQKFEQNRFNEQRSTKFEYATGSTVVIDPSNESSTFALDSMGRVIQTTDQLGRVRSQEWTANSDVSSALSSSAAGGPASTPTTFEYDNGNNLTKAKLPTGAAATLDYATAPSCPNAQTGNPHRPKCATDPAGNRTSMTYDLAGNQLTASRQGPGGVEASTYLREKTDRSVCGGFAGNVCKTTDAAGGVTTLTYNTAGDATQVNSPLGQTNYLYDGMSRLISATGPAGDVTTYSLNAMDQIRTTSITRAGQTRVITNSTPYDKSVARTEKDSNFPGQIELLRAGSFFGDPAGRNLVGSTPDAMSQIASTDANGNLTELYRGVSAAGTSGYAYNAANQLTSMSNDGSNCTVTALATTGQDCVAISYDYRGREAQRVFPGGASRTVAWDESDRPTRVTVKDRTQTIINDVSYTYSAAGSDQSLIQSKTSHKETGISAGAVTTYTYDHQQRLTSATEKLGATVKASWTYGYDSRGNRTKQILAGQTGATAGTTTYSYDAANKITSTSTNTTGWTHDNAGNLTANPAKNQNYSYGPALELQTITTSNTTKAFSYWGVGNSERTRDGQTVERFDLSGVIRTDTGSNNTSLNRSPAGDIVSTTTNGTTQFFVTDRQGSVIAILDATGNNTGSYSYDPYGNERTTTGAAAEANKYRYLGEKLDTSGLYKFGARYYDPTLGRFTQQDPSGQNPHYTYAGNNPINATDPSGLAYGNASIGACLILCISLGLSQDDDGQYAITGGFGAGVEAGFSLSASVGSGFVNDATAGGEFGCTGGPAQFSAGLAGGFQAGIQTPTQLGCALSWGSSFPIG